jgi:3-phenylpropionate/trans-cinnamate dioxygenase ferredoxin reductase component
MKHYKYVIVGGGMTGEAAVQGIRSVDPDGEISVFCAEVDMPYNRPPLSKALWKGDSIETVWRKADSQHVVFRLDRTVTNLLPNAKQSVDSSGERCSWDKLLLATGGSPKRLPFGDDHIIYFRTLADYRRLRALADKGKRFAVIGGGFIGSEIAAGLTINGKQVVMVFPGKGIAHRVFPEDLSQFVSQFYKDKGVELLAGETVSGLETADGQFVLKTRSNHDIRVDGVVAGIGIEPNVGLAQASKLDVENGIVVDEFLRTSHPDIYAAGDVAAFHNPALGKRMRVEHEDNANTTGRLAGENMAGKSKRYDHLPSFYSDMFELGYEAVGELDSRMETFSDWKQPNREGVIYYLQNGRVRGVLLWNVWGKVDAARVLIAESGPFRPDNLRGRIN